MDLILTSFGVSHLPRRRENNPDIFYRMPPTSMAVAGQEFMPDYAALLVAERIVMDEASYELLISGRHQSYGNVALMAKMLYDEGLLRLEDFDAIVKENSEVLALALEQDLKDIESWISPLKESLSEWHQFLDKLGGQLRDDFLQGRLSEQGINEKDRENYAEISNRMAGWLHGIASYSSYAQVTLHTMLQKPQHQTGPDSIEALRAVLSEYLSYVNANLLIARELDSGLHDWADFRPFYREKLAKAAPPTPPGEVQTETVKQLFEVSFPEFTFWTPANIVRALKDRRIVELRSLVDSAVAGNVTFDREFAVRVLREVLTIERSIGKFRNLVSYITLPLGFIPWVGTLVQKGAEEAIVQPAAHKQKERYRWFYLISELADRAQHELSKVPPGT